MCIRDRAYLGNGVPESSPVSKEYENLTDMNRIELVGALILTFTIVVVGVYPSIVTDFFSVGIGEIFLR